eukprot:865092-Pyramimonas_sp.AAC.1
MQEWRDRAEYFLDTIQEDLLDANDEREKLLQQSWDEWQQKALAGSARLMRRFTKLQKKWQPTVTQVAPGIYSADPVKLLEAEAAHLGGYWKAQTRPQRRGYLTEAVSLELVLIIFGWHR